MTNIDQKAGRAFKLLLRFEETIDNVAESRMC